LRPELIGRNQGRINGGASHQPSWGCQEVLGFFQELAGLVDGLGGVLGRDGGLECMIALETAIEGTQEPAMEFGIQQAGFDEMLAGKGVDSG
jgi:hypothetical protein